MPKLNATRATILNRRRKHSEDWKYSLVELGFITFHIPDELEPMPPMRAVISTGVNRECRFQARLWHRDVAWKMTALSCLLSLHDTPAKFPNEARRRSLDQVPECKGSGSEEVAPRTAGGSVAGRPRSESEKNSSKACMDTAGKLRFRELTSASIRPVSIAYPNFHPWKTPDVGRRGRSREHNGSHLKSNGHGVTINTVPFVTRSTNDPGQSDEPPAVLLALFEG
ncbi:hypothetical protein DFH09DRAFT_1287514 [Mycena vulgaris]|nr:hypothetical protein DFH09DRAFT_1287514 [Mycena vulgaris]